jgi:hypothetical protein
LAVRLMGSDNSFTDKMTTPTGVRITSDLLVEQDGPLHGETCGVPVSHSTGGIVNWLGGGGFLVSWWRRRNGCLLTVPFHNTRRLYTRQHGDRLGLSLALFVQNTGPWACPWLWLSD